MFSELAKDECIAAAPVLATRAHVYDTMAIDREGVPWVLTASGSRLPLVLPRVVTSDGRDEVANQFASSLSMALDNEESAALDSGRVVDLVDACGSSVTAVYSDGERVRISAQVALPEGLSRRALEALSFAISPEEFAELFKAYLRDSRNTVTPSQQWRVLAEVVVSMWGAGVSSPPPVTTDSTLLRLGRRLGRKNPPVTTQQISGPSSGAPQVLLALHLVAQDCRLASSTEADLLLITPVLAQIAAAIGRYDWFDYWARLAPFVAGSILQSREYRLQ